MRKHDGFRKAFVGTIFPSVTQLTHEGLCREFEDRLQYVRGGDVSSLELYFYSSMFENYEVWGKPSHYFDAVMIEHVSNSQNERVYSYSVFYMIDRVFRDFNYVRPKLERND